MLVEFFVQEERVVGAVCKNLFMLCVVQSMAKKNIHVMLPACLRPCS